MWKQGCFHGTSALYLLSFELIGLQLNQKVPRPKI